MGLTTRSSTKIRTQFKCVLSCLDLPPDVGDEDMNLDEVMMDDEVEAAAILDLDDDERASMCTCAVGNPSLVLGETKDIDPQGCALYS
jgi:hypothetical protein